MAGIVSSAKELVRRTAPGALGPLRRLRRTLRRSRHRVRERVQPVGVGRAELAAAFRGAGLREGDAVFLHSTLSRFGTIEGGPATVIGALEDVLGGKGLIAMPAFPLTGDTVEYVSNDPVFDVRTSPSTMGALTEHFRTLPGVVRSLHPTHSVSARGPGAEEIVAGHERAETPFGAGTPFAKLIDRGAHQVWFGTGLRIFTMYHAFESLHPEFPIPVYLDRRFDVRCVDASGREQVVTTLVHDPAVGRRKDPTRDRIRAHLEQTGILRSAEVGRGEILAAPLPELMGELETLLERGVTIYAFDHREAVA